MSLLVWLPLNGSLENKGIEGNGLINNGAVVNNSGKIGKCYYNNGTNSNLKIPIKTSKTMTFMLWIKIPFDPTTISGFKHIIDCRDGGVGYEPLVFMPTYLKFFNSSKNLLFSEYNDFKDKWHHIATTINANTKETKLFIDGELKVIATSNESSENALGYAVIGSRYSNEYYIEEYINDIRIYDECLSKEQIHQISQGLILHYPLNSGYGNENLIIGSGKYTKNSPLVRTKNAVDGWQKESTLYTDTIEAGTYTLQAKTDGNWHNHSTPSGGYSPDLKYCSIWLVSDAANNESGKDINICLGQTVPKSIVLSHKGKYWIRTNLYSNGTDNLTINFWDFKLEKGEKCSLWSPNEADDLYSILGYDSTTVYDTSGLGNDGVMVNNIIHTSDTPLYDSSVNLQRTKSNYINLQNTYITNQSTINFWGKVNTFSGWQRFFEFCNVLQGATGNHRILLGTNQNTQQLGLHIYGGETGTTSLYVNNNITTIDTNWHMYSIVFNKTNLKVFMDGKSIVNATMTQELTSMIRQYSYIGKSSYSADSYFDGNISDFRIYATALSAEDIKQLYQTKARIDKSGNLYCNQFVEMDNERNLLDTDDYWISVRTSGTYKQEKIECSDSVSGTATKITCTAAGSDGFYMSGHKVFDKTTLINGKQYIISLYAKSDNRTSIRFNVECSSKQSKSTFTIGAEYRRICIIYTYSNTATYNAFTSYGGWAVDENVYIHSIKVTEYNPTTHFKNNSVVETNSFIEIKSEEKCKIYKQDIQSNEIIEI